jgi:uncharacterized membrane protein
MNEENSPTEQSEQAESSGIIGTGRLEAFSDGVLAVIITIMVLEIRRPEHATIDSLRLIIPELLIYLLSFTFVGIYWNNHHHLLRATRRINSAVMWANLHLLFWISLIPLATNWSGEFDRDALPAVAYGFIGFMAGIAYFTLSRIIVRVNSGTGIEKALGSDFKGILSLFIYLLGMALTAVPDIGSIISYSVYAVVAVMWFIPDRRLAPR